MRLRQQIFAGCVLVIAAATAASLWLMAERAHAARATSAAAVLQAQERTWQTIETLLAATARPAPGAQAGSVPLRIAMPTGAAADAAPWMVSLLEQAAAATGAVPVLTDTDGKVTGFPAAFGRFARVAERLRGVEPGGIELVVADRVVSVATVQRRDPTGALVGGRRWLTDVTEQRWAQDRDDLVAAAAVLGVALLLIGAVALGLRRAFRPIEQALAAQAAVAAGDLTVTLPGQERTDEIGAAMRATLLFRQARMALSRRGRADGWRRRNRLRCVETVYAEVARAMVEPARTALAREAAELVAAAEARAVADPTDDGGDILAIALRALGERCLGQDRQLSGLLAERDAVRTRHARLDTLEGEFSRLEVLQARLAPPPLPAASGVAVSGQMLRRGEFGGDFHDFFWFDAAGGRRLAILVGCVRGSGLDAAFLMVAVRALVRALAPATAGPGECLAQVSDHLLRDNDARLAVSALLAVLDPGARKVVVASAAAPPPILIMRPGVADLLDLPAAPPLGLRPHSRIPSTGFALPNRATLVAYSAGVAEMRRSGEAPLGATGFAELLGRSVAFEPDDLLNHTMRDLAAPGSHRAGDATIVVARSGETRDSAPVFAEDGTSTSWHPLQDRRRRASDHPREAGHSLERAE